MPKENTSIHANHRRRVFDEVKRGGFEHWPEHRVLEYLLFFCIPRADTNPIAHALIDSFGSFANVLEASEEQLLKVKGVGPATARFLHTILAMDRYYLVSKTKEGTRLNTTESRVNYLLPLFRGYKKERFYMIALDERAKVIKPILLADGSSNTVNVSIPKVVNEAALSGAMSVVLAHNHPNKLPIPSQGDIEATGVIVRALGMMEIRVLDHIIVSDEEWFSLFERGRMPLFNMKTGELRYF